MDHNYLSFLISLRNLLDSFEEHLVKTYTLSESMTYGKWFRIFLEFVHWDDGFREIFWREEAINEMS